MRKRDEVFALEIVNNLQEHGNLEEAKERAARYAYDPPYGQGQYTKEGALKKANAKLKKLDVKEAIAELIEGATFDAKTGRGFSKVEGLGWLVKHIRGEIVEQKLNRDGEIVEVKRGASLPALNTYIGLTIPEEPKHLRVQSESVSLNKTIVRQESDRDVPTMVARPIGERPHEHHELPEEHEPDGDCRDVSTVSE